MVEVSVFISPTSNTKLNLSSLFIELPTNKRIAYFYTILQLLNHIPLRFVSQNNVYKKKKNNIYAENYWL